MDSISTSEEGHHLGKVKTLENEDNLRVVCTFNNRFKAAVYYPMYGRAGASSIFDGYVSKNVAKMAMRMTSEMKPYTSDAFVSISTFGYLKDFRPNCDTTGNHNGAAM